MSGKWTRLNPSVAAGLAMVLAAALTVLVIAAPVQLQFHIGYGIPIFLCAWTRNRRFLWTVASVVLVVTIAKIIWSPRPSNMMGPWYFWGNRAIAITTLAACAAITHVLINQIEGMSLRGAELEASNAELAAREEKIAQQNHQMQVQAGEKAQLFESMENERQRLKTILATVPVGVTIADRASGKITCNTAAGEMLGIEPDVPQDLDQIRERFSTIARDGDQYNRQGVVRAMEGEAISSLEREFHFPDGRRLVVLVSAAPQMDRTGKIVGAISGFVDITQQKQMQAELDRQRREAEEASGRKSRFLAAVSHDIRTPANAIILLAELLQRGNNDPAISDESKELARDLKSSALSLVQLVSDVLDLTRFDSGGIDLVESEFPLAPLIDEQCRQFTPQAHLKGLSFKCDMPPDGFVLRTDRIKVVRVLSNLIGNAVKFTSQGGISISIQRAAGGDLEIRVSDTGPGIPPEHHRRIFDEYFQVKNAQRDNDKGSGLGLAICQRLAAAIGAAITVQSQAGAGATFTLVLPGKCVLKT